MEQQAEQTKQRKGGRPKGARQRPVHVRLGELTDRAILRAINESLKDGGVPSHGLLNTAIKRLGQVDEPNRHKIEAGMGDERARLEQARARKAERETPRGAA